jgi:hypothetical protein
MVAGMRVGGCKMLWQGCQGWQGWKKKIKGSTLQEALCAFFPMHPDLPAERVNDSGTPVVIRLVSKRV